MVLSRDGFLRFSRPIPRVRLDFEQPFRIADCGSRPSYRRNQVAEGYKAMDERRAIKTLLKP
jgi:hypothetical protein